MKAIYNLYQMEKTPLVQCLLYKNSFLGGSYLLQPLSHTIDNAWNLPLLFSKVKWKLKIEHLF